MRPRITEQSYRPRVSDRTMRYRLFKADNRHLLVSFRRPNGVVTTRTWNHSGGGEKSLTAAEKDHTLTDRVCAFKTSWAECRDQKRCRHRANGGDFSLDIHSYRTILFASIEGVEHYDLRVLAVLVTWFGMHAPWVSADRLTKVVET